MGTDAHPPTQKWAALPCSQFSIELVPGSHRLSQPVSQQWDGRASSLVCLFAGQTPCLWCQHPTATPHCMFFLVPGGISVSQCSKEDGRSSSGPPHETAAPKRTYDMMEGRVGRTITSASIEGKWPAVPGASQTPRLEWKGR